MLYIRKDELKMKYYINLLKRKKYKILLFYLILFSLGICIIYFNFFGVIIRNISRSNFIYNDELGTTDIVMTIVGIFLVYISLPSNSPYAQEDSDYTVESKGDSVYIRFRKNEFLIEKENLQPQSFFYKDKNNHFVSVTRGYRIYNYVNMYYKKFLERQLDESKVISKSEVVTKFTNTRKMSNEEKYNFMNTYGIDNKIKLFFIITSVLLWSNFVFWSLGLFFSIIDKDVYVSFTVVSIGMMVFSYIFGKKSNQAIFMSKNLVKRILNEDMYFIECKIYDKKQAVFSKMAGATHQYYYVKITDGNYILNEWLEVPKKVYLKNNSSIKIYFLSGVEGEKIFIK